MVVGLLKKYFIHISKVSGAIDDQCKKGEFGVWQIIFHFQPKEK